MELHGKNLIGGEVSALGSILYSAYDPGQGRKIDPLFAEATLDEIDLAVRLADSAFCVYRQIPYEKIAVFLEKIAKEVLSLGDALIIRAHEETGLPQERLVSERSRTINQIHMFAGLLREGFWRDVRIDRAIPDRRPVAKPDIRRILIPLGPVGVWGASNFPIAFSVAGGDTISALAAGNPVIVKAHPGHPGTSEMVGEAIVHAIRSVGFPPGVFSLIHGSAPDVSLALVRHSLLKAAAFTGSLKAGRALYDAASRRTQPIPFFAEMGSINPVFLLPAAVEQRGEAIAAELSCAVNLGVGQFCTNPGLVIAMETPGLDLLIKHLRSSFVQAPIGTMLRPGIQQSYETAVERIQNIAGVQSTRSREPADAEKTEARPTLFEAEALVFLQHCELRDEVFGPCTVFVRCRSWEEMERITQALEGSLTATLQGTAEDFICYRTLISLLEVKVGRLILNGYPTGIEVCPSMNHGGPYPATTDSRFTSLGTTAIQRFVRPICYQNFAPDLLPPELQGPNQRIEPDGEWALIKAT